MAPQWNEVGTMLNFTVADLENIASTCQRDNVACCRKLLSLWLQGHNNNNDGRGKTWNTLLEVMRDAHLGELAVKLENLLYSS